MDSTLTAAGSLSNGNKGAPVATHCMDVLDAVYWTARSFEGGARALAGRMHTRDKIDGALVPMNENTFTHKVNPNCFSHNVSVEEARDMMVLSGDYRILYAIAADTGHVVIPVGACSEGHTFERIAQMAKEFGDVVSSVTEAQSASGDRGTAISPNELSRVERDAVELMAALNRLLSNLRAQASGSHQ